jgi:N-acetylglucosaminyldiphosphoundecaprenol N-acetyl-beta-D-mannosaminyltransferase
VTRPVAFDVEKPATADVLGTSIFVGDLPSGTSWVLERALAGANGYVCLCNVHLFVVARHDDEVRRALAGATLAFPDGWPIAWLQRRLGHGSAARVAGPDLMARAIEDGRGFGVRHFLLGATEDVLRRLEENLARRFPGAEIAGRLSLPFFEGGDFSGTEAAIADVRRASPHVVWLSLGCPKQELWMLRHAHELAPALVAGVGAAFDFHAGTKRRAPGWVQQAGLEWLHRLLSEPRRLGSRYARTNSEFLVLSAGELLRRRRRGS